MTPIKHWYDGEPAHSTTPRHRWSGYKHISVLLKILRINTYKYVCVYIVMSKRIKRLLFIIACSSLDLSANFAKQANGKMAYPYGVDVGWECDIFFLVFVFYFGHTAYCTNANRLIVASRRDVKQHRDAKPHIHIHIHNDHQYRISCSHTVTVLNSLVFGGFGRQIKQQPWLKHTPDGISNLYNSIKWIK